MKPVIFYRVSDDGAMYRLFFEDKYVAFSTCTSRVQSVHFSPPEHREYALDMFRGDPKMWIEL